MSKRLFLLILLVVVTSISFGEVIYTWDEANPPTWSTLWVGDTASVQWFTVPQGYEATEVGIRVDRGTNTAGTINLAVRDSNHNLKGLGSVSAAANSGWFPWLSTTGLSLSAGSYYMELFTNDAALRPSLQVMYSGWGNDVYAGGWAGRGWGGGTPFTNSTDFAARLNVELVPEPATIVILGIGALLSGITKKRKFVA